MTDLNARRSALRSTVAGLLRDDRFTAHPLALERTLVDTLEKVVDEQAAELFEAYKASFNAQMAANKYLELREVELSADGDREDYIEYGVAYADEPIPRARTFTPYYDEAVRDAAFRQSANPENGPVVVKQRRNQIISTAWTDAKRPAFNPAIDQNAGVVRAD